MNGVRASGTIVHIRKFDKIYTNIVRFRFFFRIAERSIDETCNKQAKMNVSPFEDNNEHLGFTHIFGSDSSQNFVSSLYLTDGLKQHVLTNLGMLILAKGLRSFHYKTFD